MGGRVRAGLTRNGRVEKLPGLAQLAQLREVASGRGAASAEPEDQRDDPDNSLGPYPTEAAARDWKRGS